MHVTDSTSGKMKRASPVAGQLQHLSRSPLNLGPTLGVRQAMYCLSAHIIIMSTHR